jgi:fatty acid desaturase
VSDYAELKQRVAARGLFDRQPGYYALKFGVTFALAIASGAFLAWSPSIATDVPAGLLLAVATGQIGFLLHDTAHRQVFGPGARADAVVLVTGPLLMGVSGVWWKEKHDRHHAHPNDEKRDPDIQINVVAFSDRQARRKRGLARLVTRYQARLIVLLFCFEGLNLKAASVRFLATTRSRLRRTEAALLTLHTGCYCALVVLAVGPLRAVVVVAAHQLLFGLYAASVFAPNHKGMPVLDGDGGLGYLERQVVTARNVRGHPATDWWYGGLNYQIEHHLFPTLPRNRLREAQAIVRPFCAERGISYCETSLWKSYGEVYRSFQVHGAAAG